MTTSRTDLVFGRRGGGWVPDGHVTVTTGPPCDVCGRPMLLGQRRRHHVCDDSSLVGRRCVCPPGCTDRTVGDAGTCAAGCEPCTTHTGQLRSKIWADPKKTGVS